MKPVVVIAEAGVNHNGSLDMAKKLVAAAAAAGADVVKFQTFNTDLCISPETKKADYQVEQTGAKGTQYEMVKGLELGYEDFCELQAECSRCGVVFNSSAFDLESVDFLHGLKVPFWKIPSGELTNLPFLRKVAKYGEPVVMSTGMATLSEVKAAYQVFRDNGVAERDITVLQCHTDYPTRFEDVNLLAMNLLRREFPNSDVGYSDHSVGIEVCIGAVALGAQVVEKHFTLDRTLPGPDHSASLEPAELTSMISAIRNIECALGEETKKPTPSEAKIKLVARKSIVAARHISAGNVLTEQDLAVKRPGDGVNPMRWDEFVGKIAHRDYEEGDQIEP